jgi:hypothetical protein
MKIAYNVFSLSLVCVNLAQAEQFNFNDVTIIDRLATPSKALLGPFCELETSPKFAL